jgi:hypothetical protein
LSLPKHESKLAHSDESLKIVKTAENKVDSQCVDSMSNSGEFNLCTENQNISVRENKVANNVDNSHQKEENQVKLKKKSRMKLKREAILKKQLLCKQGIFDCNSIEIIEVRRVKFSKSSTVIPIQISNKTVNAVMDSGAQVTILSDKIFDNLPKKPPIVGPVKLRMADGSTLIDGKRVGPVTMKIGDAWYQYYVIVAPLAEDMLFGHDIIMSQPQCTMDFIRGVLYFDGQIILTKSENSDQENAEVKIIKRITIPAGSVKRVACKMNKINGDYVIETFQHLKVIAPKILRKAGTEPIVCFANPRDMPVVINKGQIIGRAFPVESVSEECSDPNKDFEFLKNRIVDGYYVSKSSSEGGKVPNTENKVENSLISENKNEIKNENSALNEIENKIESDSSLDNSFDVAEDDSSSVNSFDVSQIKSTLVNSCDAPENESSLINSFEVPENESSSINSFEVPEHLTSTYWVSVKNLSPGTKKKHFSIRC